VGGQTISNRRQRAGIVGRRNAKAAERAAVQKDFDRQPRQFAVAFRARLHPHLGGMPPAMRVILFFARQRNLDRAPGTPRELGRTKLETERLALAAESAA